MLQSIAKVLKKKQAVVGWAYAVVVVAGGIATALGLAVIVGWHTHNIALLRVLPTTPAMRYNTALGFLLSGLALLALGRGQRESAKVLSVVVAALGLLSLSQYIFDINLGIDQLLMQDYVTNTLYPPNTNQLDLSLPVKQFFPIVDKPLPGRPAPTTAVGFALLGTALGFVGRAMQRRKACLIGALLATVVAALSVVTLIGHLSGLVTAYRWWQVTGVAIHTAFGLLVLSTGTIALALYSDGTKRSGLPRWLPLLIGFGILTTNLFLWQAMTVYEQAEMARAGVKSGLTAILYATLIVVTLTAFLIPLVVYFAQIAQKQAFKLEQINQQLTSEITKRSSAEEKIRRLNAELEQRVIERTAQLEAANKLKDELLVREQTLSQQLTNILESISDAFYVVDKEWRFIYMNPRAGQLLQRNPDQVIGKNVWDLFPEAVNTTFYQEYHRALAENVPVQLEEFYLPLNAWIDIRAYPYLSGLSVYFQDITQRKRNEEALKQQADVLREQAALIELSYDAIIVRDPNSTIVHWNLGAEEIYGWTAEEAKGNGTHTLLQTIFPTTREDIDALLLSNQRWDGELIQTRKDGVQIVVDSRQVLVRDENARVKAILEINRDINDRKRVEEELQASEERFRATFNQAAVGIAHVGTNGKWLLVNQKLCDIVGYTHEDLQALTFQDITHPDDLNADLNYIRQMLANEIQTYSMEKRYIRKDASHLWINLTVSLVRDPSGAPKYFISAVEDISDRKRAEQQIKQLNQNLEHRVVERTTQLETANKELEAFSYSVSHDLRAPLRSIDGFSQVLLERYAKQLDDKGKNYLQRVRTASQRMGQLIDDLINLSRVTRTQMQPQTVDLSALVQQIAAELQQTQPERANVEFVIAPGVLAQGDPRLLRVVFENLLNNAWKFTSKQLHPRIEFGTTSQQNAKDTYFVRDNGAGFDMAYANKLFGAFQRLHTTDEFPGTGIGLATVQRIVHRHGGRVWAEGAVEQGATFYFTLSHE